MIVVVWFFVFVGFWGCYFEFGGVLCLCLVLGIGNLIGLLVVYFVVLVVGLLGLCCADLVWFVMRWIVCYLIVLCALISLCFGLLEVVGCYSG